MATKKKPDPEPEADEGLVVELDPDSWNRAERRQLQDQFGRAFAELVEFVNDGFFRKAFRVEQADGSYAAARLPAPPPIEVVGNVGQPVKAYPDDVLIAMLTIQHKRTDPSATEAVFAEMGAAELRAAVERGKAKTPSD